MRRVAAILLIGAAPIAAVGAQPVTQVSQSTDSKPQEEQLTLTRLSNEQPQQEQVASPGRNAQPPQPVSTPQEGRTAAVERVGGSDRCDPAKPDEKKTAECKRVIEARAGDFEHAKAAELSPEAKLLLNQQLNAVGESVADATQRLATSGQPDNSLQAMGVASIVLDRSAHPPETDKPKDPKSDPVTQAIISVLQAPPQ